MGQGKSRVQVLIMAFWSLLCATLFALAYLAFVGPLILDACGQAIGVVRSGRQGRIAEARQVRRDQAEASPQAIESALPETRIEGEGVQPNMISCVPYQHLGFYLVNNTFYLYQNSTQDNFFRQGRSSYFPGNICGMPQLDR